jgi:hypothetical protein
LIHRRVRGNDGGVRVLDLSLVEFVLGTHCPLNLDGDPVFEALGGLF